MYRWIARRSINAFALTGSGTGGLLIKPYKKSIDKITRRISDVIKDGKVWKQESLIDALNPIITWVVELSLIRSIQRRIQ